MPLYKFPTGHLIPDPSDNTEHAETKNNALLTDKELQLLKEWRNEDNTSILISISDMNDRNTYQLITSSPVHVYTMVGILTHLIKQIEERI